MKLAAVQISPTAIASAETLSISPFTSSMDISGDGSVYSEGTFPDLLPIGEIQDGALPLTSGATLTVSINPQEGNYTSIQDAIAAASPGDVIVVKTGIYQENLTIDKSLEVRSETNDSRDVIISAADDQPVVRSTSPTTTVKLSGLSLYNSQGVSAPWMEIGPGAELELENVFFGWNLDFDGQIPILEDAVNGNVNQITDWIPKGIY